MNKGSLLSRMIRQNVKMITAREIDVYVDLTDRGVLHSDAEFLRVPGGASGTMLMEIQRDLPAFAGTKVVAVLRTESQLREDANRLREEILHFLNSSCRHWEATACWSAIRNLPGYSTLMASAGQWHQLQQLANQKPRVEVRSIVLLAELLSATADGESLAPAFAAARLVLQKQSSLPTPATVPTSK